MTAHSSRLTYHLDLDLRIPRRYWSSLTKCYFSFLYLDKVRMNRKSPQNSVARPNWYKARLPPHLTKWATKCLEEK